MNMMPMSPPKAKPPTPTKAPTPGDGEKEHGFSEEKYKQLKRKLKEMMERNERFSDELDRYRRKITSLRKEKNMLLDKIAKLEGDDSELSDNSDSLVSDSESNASAMGGDLEGHKSAHPRSKLPRTANNGDQDSYYTASPQPNYNNVVAPPPSSTPRPREIKPKRPSKVAKPAKVRRVQPIERDEAGNPKLPVQIGILSVQNLGSIVWDRDAFHNDRYIWPVGYTVSRTYPSMVNEERNTLYTATIVDAGDGPRFVITPQDAPDQAITANTATGAWTSVVRRANEIRKRDHSNSASGPDYFGFTHPTIAKMIQDLPNADKCRNYVWQEFETMQARAAAGVFAAGRKKLENLEKRGRVDATAGSETASAVSTPVASGLADRNMMPGDEEEEFDQIEDDDVDVVDPHNVGPSEGSEDSAMQEG